MEEGASRSTEAWKKKVYWETTLGRLELTVQRFLDGLNLIVPFSCSADVECRDYSLLLERVITDFGADVSFGQVVEKLKEHYRIIIPASAVQNITKKHAKACFDMLEEAKELKGEEANCLIAELDGAMVPIVSFEPNKSLDKRKWRKAIWKEARLSVSRKKGSLAKIFFATMGSTERAGELLGRCAKRSGWGEKTKVHCLGDGARWIYEQVERIFGSQGKYLVDFFHLSDYLAGAARSCCKEASKEWLKIQQEKAKRNEINGVLKTLKPHIEPEEVKDENAPVRKCYRYIENRRGQFDYQGAIQEELPIGSGEIESGNKSVVQKRLKIPGAWWKVDTAENMLALRCVRINGDWLKYWKHVSTSFAEAA
jgi:hypothetical protein